MKKILLLLSISIISNTLYAQQTFQSAIGGTGEDNGWSVVRTTDGGYAIGGNTNSFGGDSSVYVVKLSSAGAMEWTRTIGESADDAGRSMIQTGDGGFAVTGRTGSPEFKVYVVKLDSAGNLEWTRKINSGLFDQGYSIIQTNDGGFAVAGNAWDSLGGFYDAFIVKLDGSGNVQWTNIVSDFNDGACSIVQTSDNGYAISGTTSSYGAGSDDLYFAKLDSLGSQVWTRTIGGTGFEVMSSLPTTLTKTNDGGYALTGLTNSFGAGNNDVYVVKLDSAGNLQWTRTVGDNGDEQGNSIIQTTDQGYVIAGTTNSFSAGDNDVYLVKLDSAGSLEWTRAVGGTGDEDGFSVVPSGDGGYTVAGSTNSFGNGDFDVYVVKIDSGGNSCANLIFITSVADTGGTPDNIGGFSGSIASVSDSGGVAGSGGILFSICLPVCTATVTASGPASFCEGDSVVLTANSGANYLWSTNDTTQSITVSISGVYSVTVTDSNACIATSTPETVTVNPDATISASGSTTFCQGDSVTLTANSPGSYLWSTNDTTQSITVSSSGVYFVTVTDSNACIGTSPPETVTVYPLPTATVTPNDTTVFCQGDSVVLSANTSVGYFWSTNDTTQSITVTISGVYFVFVTDSNGCSAESAPVTVTVNPLPNVSFTLADTVCINGGTVTLTGFPSGGTFSGSGVTGNIFDPSAAGQGSHVVTYTYTDSLGCSNSFGSLVYVDICMGINNLSQAGFEIKIFPNPSRDHFTLKALSTNVATCSLIITDLAGREIEKWNSISMNEDFNFGYELSHGTYFAEVLQGDVRKIIRLIKN